MSTMGPQAKRLLHSLKYAGVTEKPDLFENQPHPEWNIVVAYYVNTNDYDPKSAHYNKGLEVMHTELIPLCAHLDTEMYFDQVLVEDTAEYMAEECQLDKAEPGYYKCVCGVKIDDITSTSYEGITEYDTEIYYYLLSRTKMTNADVDCLIDANKIYPSEEEYAELMS